MNEQISWTVMRDYRLLWGRANSPSCCKAWGKDEGRALVVAWNQRFKGDGSAASHWAAYRLTESGCESVLLIKDEFLFCAILILNDSACFILHFGESQFYDWFFSPHLLLWNSLRIGRASPYLWKYIICQRVCLLPLPFFHGVGWSICQYFLAALFCSYTNNYFIIFMILEFEDGCGS